MEEAVEEVPKNMVSLLWNKFRAASISARQKWSSCTRFDGVSNGARFESDVKNILVLHGFTALHGITHSTHLSVYSKFHFGWSKTQKRFLNNETQLGVARQPVRKLNDFARSWFEYGPRMCQWHGARGPQT